MCSWIDYGLLCSGIEIFGVGRLCWFGVGCIGGVGWCGDGLFWCVGIGWFCILIVVCGVGVCDIFVGDIGLVVGIVSGGLCIGVMVCGVLS